MVKPSYIAHLLQSSKTVQQYWKWWLVSFLFKCFGVLVFSLFLNQYFSNGWSHSILPEWVGQGFNRTILMDLLINDASGWTDTKSKLLIVGLILFFLQFLVHTVIISTISLKYVSLQNTGKLLKRNTLPFAGYSLTFTILATGFPAILWMLYGWYLDDPFEKFTNEIPLVWSFVGLSVLTGFWLFLMYCANLFCKLHYAQKRDFKAGLKTGFVLLRKCFGHVVVLMVYLTVLIVLISWISPFYSHFPRGTWPSFYSIHFMELVCMAMEAWIFIFSVVYLSRSMFFKIKAS